MSKAPKGERFVITIIGKRNAGKSSLINAIADQEISIVSDFAGTTTDPVMKSYELLPLGPISMYDTAGIDDVGDVGEKRIKATKKILWRTHLAVLVVGESNFSDYDFSIIKELKKMNIPLVIVFNKSDKIKHSKEIFDFCNKNELKYVVVSSKNKNNIDEVKKMIIDVAPKFLKKEKVLIGDLISAGNTVLLIAPIDLAAPKGRLILPQVQVLREILDNDAIGIIVKEKEIESALSNLKNKPDLVITDSQVVLKVNGDVPDDIPMTTFSIIFARYKGDLDELINGVYKIDKLKDNDNILIAETCSHSVQCDDIGRIKIPRWLTQYTGKKLNYDVYSGHDYPENLEKYDLILHCGGCMINPVEMNRRIMEAKRRNVAITNYGLAISKLQGVFDRVIKPFYKNKNYTMKSYF